MTWPKVYGGHERSAVERFTVVEEMLVAGAPVAAHWIADRQSGPLLLRYGTEEQRRRFLPAIARGTCYFAIGMSEPNSGSDLASIETRAERVDGGWEVSGRKLWTSHAHEAHFLIILCRTSLRSDHDRHAGLSQFIIDLASAGVTIQAVASMSGRHHFNEITLDRVRVGEDMVVGNIGEGWRQVSSELAFERSGPERFLSTLPLLLAALQHANGQTSPAHEAVGRVIAEFLCVRRLSRAVTVAIAQGREPLNESALVKDVGTRLEQEMVEVSRLLVESSPNPTNPALQAALHDAILSAPGFTLRGGTTEILKTVVASGLAT